MFQDGWLYKVLEKEESDYSQEMRPTMSDRREITIQKLDSGFIRISVSRECWAQIPPNMTGDTISDDYIFNPEWNRERINKIWETMKGGTR